LGGEEDVVKRRSKFGKKSPFLLLLGVLAAVAVILVPAGSATPGGTYTANLCDSSQLVSSVCPEGVTAPALPGGSTTVYVTLHNTSGGGQTLGSANIALPSTPASALFEYTNVSASSGTANIVSGQIELRNAAVAAGGRVTVTVTLTACTTGTYDWSGLGVIDAKDDGSFAGDGLTQGAPSSLTATLAGANQCHLALTAQPQDTRKNEAISDDVFSTGDPLEVGLYDPSNNLVDIDGSVTVVKSGGDASALLGGDPSQDLSGGVASFGDLSLNKTNGSPGQADYALVFSLDGATGKTSDGFSIVNAGTTCPGGSCTLPASFGAGGGIFTTTSNVQTSFTTAGNLSLSFFTGGSVPLGCSGFTPTSSAGVTLRVEGKTGPALISIGIADKALKARFGPNYGQKDVPICVGAQRLNASGTPIPCESDAGGPWTGKQLDSKGAVASGKFRVAVCDATNHLWWSIAPNFQDPKQPKGGFPAISIVISSWGSATATDGTLLRQFTITKPNPWDYSMRP
jgi:hypothetical protein